MSEYSDFKQELLKNPAVKAEYDALAPEYDIIQAMIDARKEQNLTQKDLSLRTGIPQADISRIENGNRNPSLNMLKKLAKGLGMTLRVEFVAEGTATQDGSIATELEKDQWERLVGVTFALAVVSK